MPRTEHLPARRKRSPSVTAISAGSSGIPGGTCCATVRRPWRDCSRRESLPRIPPAMRLAGGRWRQDGRSEEHTSELQSQSNLVCRLLLEKKKKKKKQTTTQV